MGNFLIFTSRDDYAKLEGAIGAALLGITAIIAAFFFMFFLCCYSVWKKSQESQPTQQRKESCSCISRETLHSILTVVFDNVKELKVQKTSNQNNFSKLLVISDRKVPSSSIGCLAYTYYTYMMFISIMWFLATAVELTVYRKTTTCRDINVDDNSVICFDTDDGFKTVDCEMTPDIQQKQVICYLFNPTIAGIGVAFSIAKLIGVLTDIVYKIILWLTNKSRGCAIALRAAAFVVALSFLVLYLALALTKKVTKTYFIFGSVPMRITQLVLLCLTIGGLLVIPPYTEYTDEEYKKYYNVGHSDDVENNSNNNAHPTDYERM